MKAVKVITFGVSMNRVTVKNLNNEQLKKYTKSKYNFPDKEKNFDSEILNDLKNIFLNEGKEYAKELFGTEKNINLKIDKIWGNTYLDQTIGIPHNHRSSLISAVYYLTRGQITFLNPYQLLLAHLYKKDIENHNLFNSDIWTYDMAEGDMVIFNSALQHFAHYDGKNQPERMTIACDMVKEI
tara:strand:- start:47 stop:595 length:549 start_codon:yes stop_codon:yes gene_type:complete